MQKPQIACTTISTGTEGMRQQQHPEEARRPADQEKPQPSVSRRGSRCPTAPKVIAPRNAAPPKAAVIAPCTTALP